MIKNDLRSRTLTGLGWTGISQTMNQAFTWAISIVLARILGPKVYGLVGMITVFTGFAAIFGDLGLGAAIVQRKELEPRHLNAGFWTNVAMGSALSVLMVSLAPLVAAFYKEPVLLPLTAVISLKYVIDSLYVMQMALLHREMRFRTLAGIQIGSNVISGVVGLSLALYGMGPWSLVAQTLGTSVVSLTLSWRLGGWRPGFSTEMKACRELFAFSAYVFGFDVVNYWSRNLDQLLIGRFIGPAGLGIYSRAYTLMLMPLSQVSRVVGRVMFPALSSIQDDKPRVRRAYLKSISVIGLITFPMMTGLLVVSDHFVLALLGPKWIEAIPLLKLFCWVGLLQSIWTTVGWIYFSQGRTGLYFTMGLINSAACMLSFAIGIHWGIIGVAWSYLIYNSILLYPGLTVPARLIGVTFSEIARTLSPPLFSALGMSGAVWAVGQILPVGMAHWHFLVLEVLSGVVIYFALVVNLRLEAWRESRQAFLDLAGDRLRSVIMLFGRGRLLRGTTRP